MKKTPQPQQSRIINTQQTNNSLIKLGKSPRTSKIIPRRTFSRPFSTSLYTPQIICFHLTDFLFHPRNFNRRQRYELICMALWGIFWCFDISLWYLLSRELAEGYYLAMDLSNGSGGTGGTPGGSESGGNPGGPPGGSEGENTLPEPSSNKRKREDSEGEEYSGEGDLPRRGELPLAYRRADGSIVTRWVSQSK